MVQSFSEIGNRQRKGRRGLIVYRFQLKKKLDVLRHLAYGRFRSQCSLYEHKINPELIGVSRVFRKKFRLEELGRSTKNRQGEKIETVLGNFPGLMIYTLSEIFLSRYLFFS